MIVMKQHDWLDDDICEAISIMSECKGELIEFIELRMEKYCTHIGFSKQDVIALAKEFNLVVYEKDSQL